MQIFSIGLKSTGPLLSNAFADFGRCVYSPQCLGTCGNMVESDTQILMS